MLSSLIYSVNIIFPIFLIVILGRLLIRFEFITDEFALQAEKIVFKIGLPALLFLEISAADPSTAFDAKFIIFCSLGIIITFLVPCIVIPFFIKENDRRGAFIQGVYRSNFAILGVPIAENMFGKAGLEQIAMVMPFAIALFNILAVMILSICAPRESKLRLPALIKVIAFNIIKNPLIIAVTAALPFLFFQITLPAVAAKSLTYLSNITMPLSLICIGAGFRFSALKGRVGLAAAASVIKTVFMPAAAVLIAIALGIRDVQLGIVLILFGGPTAVSSYIMARNMRSDHELASQIVLLTTLLCVLTLFIGIFTLNFYKFI